MCKEIRKVHLIYKTHLDIGFTELALKVTDNYMNNFLPKAIELAEKINEIDSHPKFVWTTGSWLVYNYLETASEENVRRLENAIRKGYIAWHALPFTTHTELMDPSLFEYGLTISKRLDERFNVKTVSAKMTDVPGHTRAIIPIMAKYGIKYLHIGVNPASRLPRVPHIFRWRGVSGEEILVNYARNYGEVLEVDGLDEVLMFAHTGDNCGPAAPEEIQANIESVQMKFPLATVKASRLDEFAEKLWEMRDQFPVVSEEVGDTWIHGIGTDPIKVTQFRALLRLRDKWINEGRMKVDSTEYIKFSDKMILIPEHTWGLDLKKHLGDYRNYSKEDFIAAREKDEVNEEDIPDKYGYIGAFAMDELDALSQALFSTERKDRTYSYFERSWQEQRNYLKEAIVCLSQDKQNEVKEVFENLKAKHEEPKGIKMIPFKEYALGQFKVAFGSDGAIAKLIDRSGKVWADDENVLAGFKYENIGVEDYNFWFDHYMRNQDTTYVWSISDFSKPGMEMIQPTIKNQMHKPYIHNLVTIKEKDADIVQANLKMDEGIADKFGAPRDITIKYRFLKDTPAVEVALSWFKKDASRLPEAAWVTFCPKVDNPYLWKMDKMGERISPYEVVYDGNRNLHAVNSGIYYDGADGIVEIKTFSVPLVAPGAPKILKFDNRFADLHGGFHFNLYNNIWGTNFPMWFEEDAKFIFELRLESK